MINGHGDDAYRYTAIRANFSSNVYHRVNHDGLNRYLAGCLSCIRSYPEPEPYAPVSYTHLTLPTICSV